MNVFCLTAIPLGDAKWCYESFLFQNRRLIDITDEFITTSIKTKLWRSLEYPTNRLPLLHNYFKNNKLSIIAEFECGKTMCNGLVIVTLLGLNVDLPKEMGWNLAKAQLIKDGKEHVAKYYSYLEQ